MFPSLPPQNRKYSQGSKVTDMISTSKRIDNRSSPEDNSHTLTKKQILTSLNSFLYCGSQNPVVMTVVEWLL